MLPWLKTSFSCRKDVGSVRKKFFLTRYVNSLTHSLISVLHDIESPFPSLSFLCLFFLSWSVLFCSVLFCSVLFCSVLFCSVLSCPVALADLYCHWVTFTLVTYPALIYCHLDVDAIQGNSLSGRSSPIKDPLR